MSFCCFGEIGLQQIIGDPYSKLFIKMGPSKFGLNNVSASI